jgi:hypothetical protein
MHKVQTNYSSCTGRSSETYVAAVYALREKEIGGQNRMKLNLSNKLMLF